MEIQPTQITEAPQTNASQPIPKKGKGQAGQDAEFDGALTQAGAIGQLLSAHAPKQVVLPSKGNLGEEDFKSVEQALAMINPGPNQGQTLGQPLADALAKNALSPKVASALQAQVQAQAQAAQSNLLPTSEKAPNTLKAATSLNTGAALAGPKPWSRDWVFTGYEDENPDLRTVIQPKSDAKGAQDLDRSAGSDAAAALELMKQLVELEAMVDASGIKQAQVQPGSAVALSQLQPQLAAAGGKIEGVSDHAEGLSPEVNSKARPSAPRIAMSGSDYVSAMGGAQVASRAVGRKGHESLQDQGQEQGAGSQNQDPKLIQSNKLQGLKDLGASNADHLIAGSRFEVAQANPKAKVLDLSAPASDGAAGVISLRNAQASQAPEQAPPVDLAGHVVKGSMTKDRLASASLQNMASEINKMTASGGGEMRVHLKPDNLGELHLRVFTEGNQVAVRIQASDERAKRVIEESISSLKDSLATRNLSLAKVEVAVSGSFHASSNNGSFDQESQRNQQSGFGLMRQDANQSGGDRSYREYANGSTASSDRNRVSGGQALRASSSDAGARSSRVASGRLDVMA